MRLLPLAITGVTLMFSLALGLSCTSASGSHPTKSSFVVPPLDDDSLGTAEGLDEKGAENGASPCGSSAGSLSCVQFVKNEDAQSIVVELPAHHPQAGKTFTIHLAGIEPLRLKARDGCERKAAQKAKLRVTEALISAKRIDVMKAIEVKSEALEADIQVDGHSLSAMLQDEKLVRAYGAKGKADWCRSPNVAN